MKESVLALIAEGVNDCEIARRTGIPRTTVRHWRSPKYAPRRPYALEACARCWRATKPIRFTSADYAELLGLYLGDGSIAELDRTQGLRITLDAKYPGIVADTEALLRRVFLHNSVGRAEKDGGSCHDVWVYSQHLVCLFPQHGPGKKHERDVRLEAWQTDLVKASPGAFLRGCIRSDGCAFINRTGRHEYLSYGFSNRSRDIIDAFTAACDALGVEYRVNENRAWQVRINRRASVAVMLEHVGLKT